MPAARVDQHWARFFGVDVAKLAEPGVRVVPHAALEGWTGIWVFRRAAACLVTAPPARVPDLSDRLAGCTPADLGRPERVAALVPDATAIVGPAFHASVAPNCFLPLPDPDVRPLGPHDAPALERLRAACPAGDWDAGGPPVGVGPAAGRFHEGALVAVAHRRTLTEDACDATVITRPDWRGRGCGTAVVSAVVEHAIADGLLVLYQTLVANAPAVALARRLGFDPYATHLAVRLPA